MKIGSMIRCIEEHIITCGWMLYANIYMPVRIQKDKHVFSIRHISTKKK